MPRFVEVKYRFLPLSSFAAFFFSLLFLHFPPAVFSLLTGEFRFLFCFSSSLAAKSFSPLQISAFFAR